MTTMNSPNPGAEPVEVQLATGAAGVPSPERLAGWAGSALAAVGAAGTVVVRVVDEEEGRELNRRYRGRDRATNVLSFPFEAPAGIGVPPAPAHLGDLVICAPVVAAEAAAQGKEPEAHWAHMLVHGVLHLAGYDHVDEAGAQVMEGEERRILAAWGFPDPYADVPAAGGDAGQDEGGG